MAVVFVFRLAIFIAERGTARVYTASGAGVPSAGALLAYMKERYGVDGASDAQMGDELSALFGYPVSVASYTGAFELRKLHVQWSQMDAGATMDDARIATFHFAKIGGGVPVDTWDAGDFATLQSSLSAFWDNIKDQYPSSMVLDRMKVYKDGPGIEPPQVPVYDAELDSPGTNANISLPPQVAVSVTEKAGSKRYWGRFYLPSPAITACQTYGRLDTIVAGDFADAVDLWYETLRAAAIRPVVYRAALPVRQTAAEKRSNTTPGSLPARDASAWDIESIQVDDVLDIIRSRRFKTVLLRTQRELA